MNKEQKYDELVKFIREYDLYCRTLDNKGTVGDRIAKNVADSVLSTILRKIRDIG